MARSSVAVSDSPSYEDEINKAEPLPLKRRRASGPRKEKPIYLLFQVTDEQGNPVPNAKLNIVLATKDTGQVVAMQAKDKSLDVEKVELPKAEQSE